MKINMNNNPDIEINKKNLYLIYFIIDNEKNFKKNIVQHGLTVVYTNTMCYLGNDH